MRITDIKSFICRVPISAKAERFGVSPNIPVTRVTTDAGVIGYEFALTSPRALERARRIALNQDPQHVARFVKMGLDHCPAVELALWDILGKVAGQPVKNLLGNLRDRIPCYLTCVWPGAADQSEVTFAQQAADLANYQAQGFRAAKIRAFRRPISADADAVATIRDAVGGREAFQIMIDRTGANSGTIWTLDEAIIMARHFEALEVTWLEEPMNRGDVFDHARLRETVDMLITGGEGDLGLSMFHKYLRYGSFDIIQPDLINCGGMLTMHRIGAMAYGAGIDCVPHGTHGLLLASRLQAVATLPNCWIVEIALTNPPLLPWEQWQHCLALVNQDTLFEIDEGEVIIPDRPGMGLDVNDEAVERYRLS